MNLRQIEVFRAVMQAGSISGAAATLHVSQPAVSRLIRYLEVKLRVALFDRTGGRLHPTPEARALLREINSAYRGIDRVRAYAEQLHHGVADTLRIATNLSPALELVPRAVAGLKQLMPRLHISVEIGTHAQITEQLLAGECDIGVAAFVRAQHPAVTAEPIGEGDVLCAMAATHPLARHKSLTMAQLRQHDVISFGSETPHGKVVGQLLGRAARPIGPTVDVRYAYVACSIAASGWGVALVDDLSASRFGSSGLVLRPLARAVRYEACAMGSAERPLSAAGRTMVSLLKTHWQQARHPV
ncbi:MAG: LysR family transcriptional regulator [Ramlibacter sp.]|nr:LysR family transcriptional regulator [Ramlibacter sp.]MBX3658099.1 LysR family transcriptional regulator [Ramlibacter sp.]MCW5648609.1 LysR family transcriptional regulator [Ramlibacter sp.]